MVLVAVLLAILKMLQLKIVYLRIAYIGRQLRLGISEGNLVAKYESTDPPVKCDGKQ